MDFEKWATENLIVRIVAGSRLYGTHRKDSDYDFRGVCLDPPGAILGIQRFHQYENVTKTHDEVIYGASKFINLCIDANPSILDILFAPEDAILYTTPIWERIQRSAKLLLSQKVRYTFSGYAFSQLKRIKRHKVWIDTPPQKPSLEEYGLFLYNTSGGGQRFEPIPVAQRLSIPGFPFVDFAALRKVIRRRSLFVPQDRTAMIAAYRQAKAEYDKYMNWRKNRNPARAELEALYGYDVKHASHLVRLLLQGENILQDLDYNPVLGGKTRRRVVSVLRGNWSYERLVTFAEEQEAVVKGMDTELRRKPDTAAAADLLRYVAAASLALDEEFMKTLPEVGA